MHTFTKILLSIALGLAITSCAQDGSHVTAEGTVGDANFMVNKLFTTEGCTVYRFLDSGHYHYFTNCTSTVSQHTESCGKNCITTVGDENYTSHEYGSDPNE